MQTLLCQIFLLTILAFPKQKHAKNFECVSEVPNQHRARWDWDVHMLRWFYLHFHLISWGTRLVEPTTGSRSNLTYLNKSLSYSLNKYSILFESMVPHWSERIKPFLLAPDRHTFQASFLYNNRIRLKLKLAQSAIEQEIRGFWKFTFKKHLIIHIITGV